MPSQRPSKWTAFLLSLAVPGSGQLLAGSPTACVWFALVAAVISISLVLPSGENSWATLAIQSPLLLGVSVISAWHARGLLEPKPPWRQTRTATSQVHCTAGRQRRIRADIRIHTSLPPTELWRRISDLPVFLTVDPFHETVTLMRPRAQAGVDVVLGHNALGYRFDRFGRILWWRAGEGFAVSDLSARNRRRGFPHIFVYRVESPPTENASPSWNSPGSTLSVQVRGRWTSRVMPTWLGRWWIAAVCRYHAALLKRAF